MNTFTNAFAPAITTPAAPKPSLISFIKTMVALHRQRRDLGRMDADQLADLGITAHEAQFEANRAAWDVPATWRS